MDAANAERFKGTTTVGIVFDKGVALAADKRATMGYFIASKGVDKIFPVSDRIAMTIAGVTGDAQSLVRLIRAELELYRYSRGATLSVEGAANLLANVLQGNKYYPYIVQLILAGYDSAPRLFDLDLVGGLISEKYTSTGSGSPVAFGMLDEHYQEGMGKEDALRLAVKAVNAAIKRDSPTGDGIDLVCITKDGTKRYSKEEIAKLVG
ncbi:MAG: archaeal proteasome endopeptidase complex subunit beta [Candidatus Micrarchaeota archaeon]|nr:archaeal proteasome endopeptidase complex subunit beta [Candidatus Micrarchaeota archaeon]